MTPEQEIEWALNAPPPCAKCGCQHDDTIPVPKPAKECGCSFDWSCYPTSTHGIKTYREDACYRQQAPYWVFNPYRIGDRPDVLAKLLEYARERRALLAALTVNTDDGGGRHDPETD